MSPVVYALWDFGGLRLEEVLYARKKVQCTGNEKNLTDCVFESVLDALSCNEVAGVKCLSGKLFVMKTAQL